MDISNLFNRLKSNTFFRNVAMLASGTIISQIVVIAFSPLLARLYAVESFGLLALFTSYMVISAVVSTGRYELAMGLPEKDRDARKLFQLIVYLGSTISLFYLSVIFVAKEFLHLQDQFTILNYWWIYLAPLYIFFIALYSGLGYWLQRKKNYKKITFANALQVILTAILSVAFGFLKIQAGLILSLIIAIIISTFYLLYDYLKENQSFSFKQVKEQGKNYIGFPKHMIISDLSLTAGQQLTPILFSFLFSTTIVGFYSMANRMIRLPNIIITSAIGNVFRNDAIDEIRCSGSCRKLYVATFKKLIIMSFPIYLLIFIFSPVLFSFVFGDVWHTAGLFARILSVMLFFEFVITPLNSVFLVREKQKQLASIQLVNAVSGGLAIYVGYLFFSSAMISLIFFIISTILFNLILLYLSFRYSSDTINF